MLYMFNVNLFSLSLLLLFYRFDYFTGLPTAKLLGGISLVTTLPAPMTLPSPIVTPGITDTCPPNQVLLPTTIGSASSKPYYVLYNLKDA